MILYTEFMMIGVCGNVKHVFNPVRAVWYLELIPVDAVVLETTLPVKTKAQKFNVETVRRTQIFDDKTGMDQMRTKLPGWRSISAFRCWPVNECNGVSLWVPDPERLRAIGISLNRLWPEAVCQKVISGMRYVVGCEPNFRQPALMGTISQIIRH